jgi:glyoxylate reductase
MKMKVFIAGKLIGRAEQILEENGIDVKVFSKDRALSRNELSKELSDVDGVISFLSNKFDKEMIDSMKKCKVIANYAVGYNNIDIEYANSKKIIVTNTPDILTDATADIAATLILTCARRFYEGEKMMRENKFTGWKPEMLLGIDIKGKTVGIVGAGRIGFATAKRMKAFGTKIIYYNRSVNKKIEKELSAKKISINALLKSADIISLHLPLNNQTHHLLNEERLKLVKPTSIIVNTARGEVIDEKALIRMLKKKKIFAAGFDVYEGEPAVNSELRTLNNVVLLPHIGSATVETRSAMAELCAQNIVNVLLGKRPLTPVHFH